MKCETRKINSCRSSGAVLLLAMVFLLLIAMIAASVMHTSAMELRMAGNDQFREEAFQQVQGIVAAISQRKENFPVTGPISYMLCANSAAIEGCSADLPPLDSTLVAISSGVRLSYSVHRQGPTLLKALPFRIDQGIVSSSLAYDAAVFETRVQIDGSAVGLGSAQVAQGIAIMVTDSTH
ncbi:MAG: PilX N-terminal domain-containing pilus assembly protein [Halioglobus sp.]